MATRGKGWSHTLLMIRFLFTVSVSNAKLERMFSKLKHVKTNFCCSLVVKRLESYENYGRQQLQIAIEVSSLENFDLISAMKKQRIDKIRRITEEKESRSCKSQNSAEVNVISLIDDGSYSSQKIFLKMVTQSKVIRAGERQRSPLSFFQS